MISLVSPLKSYLGHLGQNAVHIFITSMAKEIKYCSHATKKHFKQEFVMTKEDNENFENAAKCWNCDNTFVEGEVELEIIVMLLEKIREIVISTSV